MRDLRRLFPYIRPYLPLLLLSLLLLVISALLEGLIVAMLEPIFNYWQGAPQGMAQGSFSSINRWLGIEDNAFTRIPLLLILFALFKGVFLYASEVSMSYVGQKIVATLRSRLHQRLLRQSMAFYVRQASGQIMARVITDTERIQETVSRTLTDFARQSMLLLVFLGILLYIDWVLTLAMFILAPPVLWITLLMGRRLRGVAQRSQQNLSDISQALQETIAGQRIVKAFAMEDYEQRRFDGMLRKLVRNNMGVAKISALSSPLMELIGYLAFAPLLLYAGYAVSARDGLTIGSLAAFIVALFRLYDPIRKLSRMHLHFQQAFASSSRVFALLDTPIDVKESEGARRLPPIERSIVFRQVSLRYSQTERPALDGIDLEIPKGRSVALVGSSGAGKTSLAGLIGRFYDPTSGAVLIDGQDLRQVTLESLRTQVAMVTQDTFLFNDSIRSNIAYGHPERPLQEVMEAARAAYIHDFIEELPQGYDTVIGEQGQRLSGGQRQRLAIARAVLKKAPILILDEATSSLDSESELLIQKALERLMRTSTAVVIAHRLSTVRSADEIIVMERGRILERGAHDKLMQESGAYRRLYELQFET
ncbi:MAG TPA: ABC transporter transmembrane domain-containing protein [Acidobacteriota bacterium]|nr:ABC transporter transmembrane domain-containing protein [Acidobacteriota bacterium]